jgi:hypothetical protein
MSESQNKPAFSAAALQTLGLAFNAAGDRHKMEHFKEIGQELIAEANSQILIQPPQQIGDARKTKHKLEAEIKQNPAK